MQLSPRLQKLQIDSLVLCHWMVFLKTRPYVKQNNAEFTNFSSFTLLLMCSTHLILSFRIHFFFPHHHHQLFQVCVFWNHLIVCMAGPVKDPFSGNWRSSEPDSLQFWTSDIQDFPTSCRKLLYFVFSALYTKMGWRTHSLAGTVPPILTIVVYSELRYNWDTGLPCRCPLWIYCTGQQHKGSLFPCLFSCLPSLYLQLMCHGSYLPFAQILSFHTCTIPPESWLTLFQVLAFPF